MNKSIPPYLRIHVEDPPAAVPLPSAELIPGWNQLCAAFEQSTGWPLRYYEQAPANNVELRWSAPLTVEPKAPSGLLALESPGESAPTSASFDAASKLGTALAGLVNHTLRLEHTLWLREAELAAGVPVISGSDSNRHLARRLEAALRGGAQALGCQAAGLYMLDDDTTVLKLRAAWGLPKTRLADPPRRLAAAMADLEALLGHAVVLNDPYLLDRWNPPEDFAAAVCVPVSSPSTPLGTLWFFSTTPRDFNDQQTGVAELVAGRIAADLEREMLLHPAGRVAVEPQQCSDAAAWQRKRLPSVAPLVEGWQLAGWHRSCAALSGEFFDWWVLPCGALALAVGDALHQGVVAALAATSLREQVRACSMFLARPDSILERVGQCLWSGSAGDQFAALGLARLRPDDHRVDVATAGPVHALHLHDNGCTRLGNPVPALASSPEQRYTALPLRPKPGEAVILASDGVIEARDDAGRPWGASCLAETLNAHRHASAQALADAARAALEAHQGLRAREDQTLVVLKRRGTSA
ncbi:MAG: SpoIIE family protein phosphatase [Pirellulales bacterium]|nr:SpoIIE family protein phosphatase [Pirellulales bacterium]